MWMACDGQKHHTWSKEKESYDVRLWIKTRMPWLTHLGGRSLHRGLGLQVWTHIRGLRVNGTYGTIPQRRLNVVDLDPHLK